MASNNVKETSVWEDMVLEPTRPKLTFAKRLKQSDGRIPPRDIAARGAKFETSDSLSFKEIIIYFQTKFKDPNAVQQLMQLSSLPGKQRWNIIFSKANMVDQLIKELVKFPSMTKDEIGIEFTPVRRRALLITIPDATPDISDNDIRNELEKYGTVLRIWKQTWEGFPNVFIGKRLVTMFPSMSNELPPFILTKNRKVSLSFKGKPVFCKICMKDTHRTNDCPTKNVRHCYLCGSTEHAKKECEKFVVKRREWEIVDSDEESTFNDAHKQANEPWFQSEEQNAEDNDNPPHDNEENQPQEESEDPTPSTKPKITKPKTQPEPEITTYETQEDTQPEPIQDTSTKPKRPRPVLPSTTDKRLPKETKDTLDPPQDPTIAINAYQPYKKGTKRSSPSTREKKTTKTKKTPGTSNEHHK